MVTTDVSFLRKIIYIYKKWVLCCSKALVCHIHSSTARVIQRGLGSPNNVGSVRSLCECAAQKENDGRLSLWVQHRAWQSGKGDGNVWNELGWGTRAEQRGLAVFISLTYCGTVCLSRSRLKLFWRIDAPIMVLLLGLWMVEFEVWQVWFKAVYLHAAIVQLSYLFSMSSRFRNNVRWVRIIK